MNLGANSFRVCIEQQGHLRTLSRTDFIHHYENQKVLVGRKLINPANVWLASTSRRELMGYKFAPNLSIKQCEKDGYYNLFRGFSYIGKEHNTTGLKIYLEFIEEVICNGNNKIFNW